MQAIDAGSKLLYEGSVSGITIAPNVVTDCGTVVMTPTANMIPLAFAGPDQRVAVGDTVTLDGLSSTAGAPATLSYSWLFQSKPTSSTALLSDATLVRPVFVADLPGEYCLQLTVDNSFVTSSPDTVCINVGNAATISDGLFAGVRSSYYIDNTGTLWGWGNNINGSTPTMTGPVASWKQVAVGDNFVLALKLDGSLWSWGRNDQGQLGNGLISSEESGLAQIGTDTNWSQITAGSSYGLALKSDGTLWSWGFNLSGELGDGTTVNNSIPTQIGTSTDWDFVAAGSAFSAALKRNGTLWVWGNNTDGQLGNGTNSMSLQPIEVGTPSGFWTSISLGYYHVMATKNDGTLWAWGSNSHGQLGDSSIISKNSPIRIGTATDWKQIDAGLTSYTMAIKTDGTLWGWGYNALGELGDGTNIKRTVPVKIGTATDWSQVAAGYYFTLAKKTDGTLWAWGDNWNGQLGSGTTVDSNVPVSVVGF